MPRDALVLQLHAARKVAEGGEVITEALIAQPLTQLSNRIVIEPPSATQEEEIEGVEPEPIEDERPLSRCEPAKGGYGNDNRHNSFN